MRSRSRGRAPKPLAPVIRRVLIWGVFFGLLFLLRAFFPLLLLTFVLSYGADRAVTALAGRFPRMPRRALVACVFAGLIAVLVGSGLLLGPVLHGEQRNFVQRFPELRESIASSVAKARAESPELFRALDPGSDLVQDIREFELKDLRRKQRVDRTPVPLLDDVSPLLLDFARIAAQAAGTFLLALLFSFLILLDMPKLRREIEAIRSSRIGWLHQEVRGTVVDFCDALGRVLESQVVIAVVNTCLTFLGLLVIGVPSVWLLSLLVFLCSFIPVLGVFISTTPICVIALAKGGLTMALQCIGMVVAVHAVEAYLLNPRITGSHVRLNPVLVLAVLVAGEHLFGLWGLILGVPVAVTLLRKTRDIVRREGTEEVSGSPVALSDAAHAAAHAGRGESLAGVVEDRAVGQDAS